MQSKQSEIYTLDNDDVITSIPAGYELGTGMTFTTQQLVQRFGDPLGITPGRNNYAWISDGVSGKVLSANGNISGWQQGKIRLVFEFVPDEQIQDKNEKIDPSLDSFRHPQ